MTDTGIGSTLETAPGSVDAPEPSRRFGVPFLPAIFLAAALLFLGAVAGTWWANRETSPSSVDIGFYDDMSSHHLQAIKMANIYERNGDNDDLRSRALEIEFEQIGDVRVMQDSLSEWGETGSPDTAMEWMGAAVPTDQMPGLASADGNGTARGGSWLRARRSVHALMIQHHEGGVHMAEHAARLRA